MLRTSQHRHCLRRHCLRQTRSVCARERLRRSNSYFHCRSVDCFASLDDCAAIVGKYVMRKFVVAALAVLAFGGAASAQNYPSRPITLIVPFSAGGPSDVMARILA